jgi:hypothetical protein
VLAGAVLTALLLASAAPALATQAYVPGTPFGSSGSGAGQLSNPQGVAVASGGDVYVADAGNSRVDVFSSDGSFLFAFGADVGGAGVNACTATCQPGTPGSAPGQFVSPTFVAVDNSGGPSNGDVYVADTAGNVISKFDASGTLVSSWGTGGQLSGFSGGSFGGLVGVAVGAGGDLLTADTSVQEFVFGQDGSQISQTQLTRSMGSSGVGVDGSGNFFKVNADGSTENYTGAGSDIGQVTNDTAAGITVDPGTGHLFVDTGSQVDRYEFDGSGNVLESSGSPCPPEQFVGCDPTGSFGSGTVSEGTGIGVDPAIATVYVAESSGQVQPFSLVNVPDPTVSLDDPSSVTDTSVQLSGAVNPNGFDTTWHFEYVDDPHFRRGGFAAATGIPVPGGDAGSGSSDVPVSADPTGLVPGTLYHVRLVAGNGLGPAVDSSAQTFTTTATAPIVSGAMPIFDLTRTSAVLTGVVSDFGAPVGDCHFVWGATTAYGHSAACTTAPAAAQAPGSATYRLEGLTPGAAYHFRLDVTTTGGTATGPDETFTTPNPTFPACANQALRTGASANLSDCRAYEQVSPVQKNGLSVFAASVHTHVAASGDGVLYPSTGGFADAHGLPLITSYLAERSRTGWASHNVNPKTPPLSASFFTRGAAESYLAVSPDLSAGVFGSGWSLTSDPNTQNIINLYLRPDLQTPGDGAWQLASPCPACTSPLTPPKTTGQPNPPRNIFIGASTDLRHLVFETPYQLTPGAPAGAVYDYHDGTLSLVSVLSDGTPTTGGVGDPGNAFDLQVSSAVLHAVSSDGSRISFTDGNGAGDEGIEGMYSGGALSGTLYQRIDGTTTVQLSASEKTNGAGPGGTDPSGPLPATFQDASADGTRVFFTSQEALTNDAGDQTGGGCVGCTNLYLYDANAPAGHHLALITGSTGLSIVGGSDDGHYLYFLSQGSLVANQLPSNPFQTLYVWHDGTIRVAANDVQVNTGSFGAPDFGADGANPLYGNFHPGNEIMARTTPDGHSVLFVTQGDNSGRGPTGDPQGSGETKTYQLYLYNFDQNSLTCVSCNPAGLSTSSGSDVSVPNGQYPTPFSLDDALSSDGRFVFFSTAQALVPEDTNGTVDAYEFDSQTGQVHLLSSGQDPNPSSFVNAGPDGHDVFISTFQQLVGQDTDQAADLYDARIDGGIAAQNPPPSPPPCTDPTGCQGPASAPGLPAVGSATFVGSGNAPALETPPANPKLKPASAARKLAKALKVCRSKHGKKRRSACEKRARNSYRRGK